MKTHTRISINIAKISKRPISEPKPLSNVHLNTNSVVCFSVMEHVHHVWKEIFAKNGNINIRINCSIKKHDWPQLSTRKASPYHLKYTAISWLYLEHSCGHTSRVCFDDEKPILDGCHCLSEQHTRLTNPPSPNHSVPNSDVPLPI